jgi:hypothetical protein
MAEIDALLWKLMELPENYLTLVFDGRDSRSSLSDVSDYLVDWEH